MTGFSAFEDEKAFDANTATRLTDHPVQVLFRLAKDRNSVLTVPLVAYQRYLTDAIDKEYRETTLRAHEPLVIDPAMSQRTLDTEVHCVARRALVKLAALGFEHIHPMRVSQSDDDFDLSRIEWGIQLKVWARSKNLPTGLDTLSHETDPFALPVSTGEVEALIPACDLDGSVELEQLPGIADKLAGLWASMAGAAGATGDMVSFFRTGNGYHAYLGDALQGGDQYTWYKEVRRFPFVDEKWARKAESAPSVNGVLRWSDGAAGKDRMIPERVNL